MVDLCSSCGIFKSELEEGLRTMCVTSSLLRSTEPGGVPRAKGQEFPLSKKSHFFGTV